LLPVQLKKNCIQKASILVLGSLSGSILGGLQSQKMGRKHSIMFDSVLFISATIIFILAKDLNMVLIGRYIQGRLSLRFEFSV
jgi:predicted MFS family arabinose efflux permease